MCVREREEDRARERNRERERKRETKGGRIRKDKDKTHLNQKFLFDCLASLVMSKRAKYEV